nr:AAA family ATPase [Acholeplasma laidlawii]
MSNSKYRLSKITIENIKNTEYGEISFPVQGINNERKAGLLGIYGANGSGKTAVIYALNILKTLMSGYALDNDTYNYITKGKNEAKLKFEFDFETKDLISYIAYEFILAKDNDEPLYVKDEKVTYKRQEDSRTIVLIDTTRDESTDLLFSPKLKYEHVKKDKDTLIDLMVSSKMAHEKGNHLSLEKKHLTF